MQSKANCLRRQLISRRTFVVCKTHFSILATLPSSSPIHRVFKTYSTDNPFYILQNSVYHFNKYSSHKGQESIFSCPSFYPAHNVPSQTVSQCHSEESVTILSLNIIPKSTFMEVIGPNYKRQTKIIAVYAAM